MPFDTEIQIDELADDEAYAEWHWRQELAIREALDEEAEIDEINLELAAIDSPL